MRGPTVSEEGVILARAGGDGSSERRARFPAFELSVGLVAGAASLVVYAERGYGRGMLVLWLLALVSLTTAFAVAGGSRVGALRLPAWPDLALPAGLALAFSPLYLVNSYDWPVQVNSDEVVVMVQSKRWAGLQDVDLFGLTDVFGVPALIFVALGEVGALVGGVDLLHMRLLHGALGLATIMAAYAFFRQLLPRTWAAVATAVLGANHALFMLSRMAMRENTAVLLEAAALALLVRGLRRDHPLSAFAGGVLAGLGFYVYFPGRITIFLWLLFLGALALWFGALRLRLLALGAVALSGFALVAGPVIIAGLQVPPEADYQQRSALMIFPEARELQRSWVFADSVAEGYGKNVLWGLTAFNNTVVDHGWIYPNHGHGFLDPLTGVLLWVGVIAVVVRLRRGRASPLDLLPLLGFVVLWLSFAFVVNKAPNYTRLLVVLPFVAYLAAVGIRALAQFAGRRWGPRAVPLVAGGALAAIAVWNVAIAWDYVDRGRRLGDDIGSTGRLIETLRDVPGQRFYIAASQQEQYFTWGFPQMYAERMRHFAGNERRVGGIVPAELAGSFAARPPFALFMPRAVWDRHGRALRERYPNARLRDVTPDGRLVLLDAGAEVGA